MKKQTFRPSQEAINTALTLFSLMALHQQAKEHELNIRTQILDAKKYPCDPDRLIEFRKRGIEINEVIKNPKEDYLIEGLTDLNNPNTPWAEYYSNWDRRMTNLGYIYGANTTCKIDTEIRDTRKKLFYQVQDFPNVPQIEYEQLISVRLEYYHQFFELTLQLLAPYCTNTDDQTKISKAIYSKYINQ